MIKRKSACHGARAFMKAKVLQGSESCLKSLSSASNIPSQQGPISNFFAKIAWILKLKADDRSRFASA